MTRVCFTINWIKFEQTEVFAQFIIYITPQNIAIESRVINRREWAAYNRKSNATLALQSLYL